MAFKIKLGSNVMIKHSRVKSYIGKFGKVIAKGKDDFWEKPIYLIDVKEKNKPIWQYASELEKR